METIDLKKIYKHLYNVSAKKIEIVDVPPLNFIRVDGAIEPGQAPGTSPLFEENIGAMYSAAYTLKFMFKMRKENPVDYPVMALEGLWWVEDGHFDIKVKDNWFYTLMILQPEIITPAVFAEGLAQARKKKGDLPGLARLRLECYHEGLTVQTLHLGPYDTEPATFDRMEAFAHANGLKFGPTHHEIYMGDPRKADPAKLKTILRHPVEKI